MRHVYLVGVVIYIIFVQYASSLYSLPKTGPYEVKQSENAYDNTKSIYIKARVVKVGYKVAKIIGGVILGIVILIIKYVCKGICYCCCGTNHKEENEENTTLDV